MTTDVFQAVILGHFQYAAFVIGLAFFSGGAIFVIRLLLRLFHGRSRQ